jgi:hypothetical protein
MFSAILPGADIRQGMLKAYRFTLQMPACCTICATGRSSPGSRLKFTVGGHAKSLDDRSRQNSLALAGRGDVVTERLQLVGQRLSREDIHLLAATY